MNLNQETRFLEHLQQFVPQDTPEGFRKGNRGALAALRRGLGRKPGTEIAMYPFVGSWVGSKSDRDAEPFFLVASLFALHPKHDPNLRSLGESFSKLFRESSSPESLEHRFTALLNADREELHIHLRHAVSLLKSKGIAINYAQLIRDIRWWGERGSGTRRTLARDFWTSLKPESTDNEQE